MKNVPIVFVLGPFFHEGIKYTYKGFANTRFICENVETKEEVQISAYSTVQIPDEEAETYIRCIKDSLGRNFSSIREAGEALAMLGEKKAEFEKEAIRAIESYIAGVRDAFYFKLEEKAIRGSGKVTYEDAKKLIEEMTQGDKPPV